MHSVLVGLSSAMVSKLKTDCQFPHKNFYFVDGLIKKLDELERTSELYRGLIEHTRAVLKAIFELAHTHRGFGDAFANIGAREPQFKAWEAFTKFGEAHRQIDRHAITLLRTVKPVRR